MSAPHGAPQPAPTPVPFPAPTEQPRPITVFPDALDCPPVVAQPGPVPQQPTPVISANPLPTPGVRGPVVSPITGLPADIAGNTHYLPTQPYVNKDVVAAYAEQLRNDPQAFWEQFDEPIEITTAPNGVFITDGHHRFLAVKLVGLDFPADVPPGSIDFLPPQSTPWQQPYGRNPWTQIWQWNNVQWR
jgi:hypothetical protein